MKCHIIFTLCVAGTIYGMEYDVERQQHQVLIPDSPATPSLQYAQSLIQSNQELPINHRQSQLDEVSMQRYQHQPINQRRFHRIMPHQYAQTDCRSLAAIFAFGVIVGIKVCSWFVACNSESV